MLCEFHLLQLDADVEMLLEHTLNRLGDGDVASAPCIELQGNLRKSSTIGEAGFSHKLTSTCRVERITTDAVRAVVGHGRWHESVVGRTRGLTLENVPNDTIAVDGEVDGPTHPRIAEDVLGGDHAIELR